MAQHFFPPSPSGTKHSQSDSHSQYDTCQTIHATITLRITLTTHTYTQPGLSRVSDRNKFQWLLQYYANGARAITITVWARKRHKQLMLRNPMESRGNLLFCTFLHAYISIFDWDSVPESVRHSYVVELAGFIAYGSSSSQSEGKSHFPTDIFSPPHSSWPCTIGRRTTNGCGVWENIGISLDLESFRASSTAARLHVYT